MNNTQSTDTIEKDIVEMCPILYQMHDHDMTETCMCWGFEHGSGWEIPIRKMACSLEMLNNLYYPKYRVRIQMDQQKEKFGTLHAYFSVVVDPGKFGCAFNQLFRKMALKLNTVDYRYKTVVDVVPHDYDEVRKLTKEEYDAKTSAKFKCSNVEYFVDNGEFKEVVHLHSYGLTHLEPTQHKFLNRLMKICRRLSHTFDRYRKEHTYMQKAIVCYMNELACEIVEKAEKECYDVCEFCGDLIGTSWSPRCETTGWIRYLCDKCAEQHKLEYRKDGALWRNGKIVKSKEQYDRELQELEKRRVSDF